MRLVPRTFTYGVNRVESTQFKYSFTFITSKNQTEQLEHQHQFNLEKKSQFQILERNQNEV